MLDEQALKQRLQAIAANGYDAPTLPELSYLVTAMVSFIGTVEPELRDDLIYMTPAVWIEGDLFEPKDLKEILMVSLNDQHLIYGLGEEESDTVTSSSSGDSPLNLAVQPFL